MVYQQMTAKIKKILANYESDNPGTIANLTRLLMHGELGGTGNLIILPVDQGFEHGPARSFYANEAAYDPYYHFELAIEARLSAFAAPLGMIELGARQYANEIPLILKINSNNSLHNIEANQAVTASVKDALRLGCSAIGFTIYPGAANTIEMIEEFRQIAEEAKRCGLVVIAWAYPRGGLISKSAEQALDVIAYAAHLSCLIGAHIVKVKLPDDLIGLEESKKAYANTNFSKLSDRVAHVMLSAFNCKRLVVFSGGAGKTIESVLDDAKAILLGGGNGSIIGRNSFQRPRKEALEMLAKMIEIYKN